MASLVNLQKKMLQEAKIVERNSNGENDPDHLSEDEERGPAIVKPENMIVSTSNQIKSKHVNELQEPVFVLLTRPQSDLL